MSLIVVYEGDTDLPIIRKLVKDAGLEIALELDTSGKEALDRDLGRYNESGCAAWRRVGIGT